MTVVVEVSLSDAETTWPALPRCTVQVRNEGDEPARWINAEHVMGRCGLRLKELSTETTTSWHDPIPGGIESAERRLESGDQLSDEMLLTPLLPLPSPGRYEVCAVATVDGQEIISAPASFDVHAASVSALDHAPMGGSPGGNELCAWVQTTQAGARLWLSTLTAMYTPRFFVSEPVVDLAARVWPVLSVPARRNSVRPHVAWMDGRGLQWAASDDPGYTQGSIACEPTWQLVAPLCENPFDGVRLPDADALLVAADPDEWAMRVAHLGRGTLSTPTRFGGAPPVWGSTVVHADGRRDTFTLHASAHDGASTLMLARFGWGPGQTPAAPKTIATVAGNLVAATVRPTVSGSVTGVIASRIAGAPARYVLHRLKMATADDPVRVEPLVELPVPGGAVVTQLQVYGSHTGRMHALLHLHSRTAPPQWAVWIEGRGLTALPDTVAGAPGPISLYFLHGSRPALLWADPGAGLRLHPVDEPLTPVPLG